MSNWTVDILEPDSDVNVAVEKLGSVIGRLYQESWHTDKEPLYQKPFSLNAEVFARMWFSKALKIFIAYDEKHEAVGYLLGLVFRPLPYEASVFQVEDWFTRGNIELERQLFDHATQAIRYIGCDEIWVSDHADRVPHVSSVWKQRGSFTFRRYLKE